jgi:hypothetical protein
MKFKCYIPQKKPGESHTLWRGVGSGALEAKLNRVADLADALEDQTEDREACDRVSCGKRVTE